MVSQVGAAFERAAKENRAALVGYLPAGVPDRQGCIDALVAMVRSGVDVVEIGLPYSDPVLDGPTIQRAADQALANGTRIADVFATVEAVAATGAATLVMTYWNPVLRYGVDRFARDLAAAGGAGLITPDLTPDSGPDWIAASQAHDLDRVFLVAPSTTDKRLRLTADACRGFIYATAVMGVTGAREQTSSLAPTLVSRLREVSDLPIGVGLGVSNGDQAAEIGAFADGVIVGSAFVRCLLDTDIAAGVSAAGALAADLAAGVRRR
jgi:tryptophan synthase alpha chain